MYAPIPEEKESMFLFPRKILESFLRFLEKELIPEISERIP